MNALWDDLTDNGLGSDVPRSVIIIQVPAPHLTRPHGEHPSSCLLSFMINRERRNKVMLSNISSYHAAAQNQKLEQICYGNLGNRGPVSTLPAAAHTQKSSKYCMVTRVLGYPGTRVHVSAGTWVPGSGSTLSAPHPIGYPVPFFLGRGAPVQWLLTGSSTIYCSGKKN